MFNIEQKLEELVRSLLYLILKKPALQALE
jgi:hypothetical protein